MGADVREWIALSLVAGVGSRTALRLLERFGSPADVFAASRSELQACGVEDEVIDRIGSAQSRQRAEEEWTRVTRLGAEVLTFEDPRYPPLLRRIYDPPIVLYALGRLEVLSAPLLAIVGTRRPTPYGVNVATQLARDLAARGVTIVSGFARGIDAAAHRGALEAKGTTVAVLGTGLDQVYPREHRALAEQIRQQGVLVTEFPTGVAPLPQNFPFRNRIISGMSLGVVVVEAAEHSGSLITARLALEQDREVFAVPGPITSPRSYGPNYLIKCGAKLVQYWRDVVEELPREVRAEILRRESDVAPTTPAQPELPLDEPARRVLELLHVDVPTHIDELLLRSGLPVPELMRVLLELEVRDRIRQLPGKQFVKKL